MKRTFLWILMAGLLLSRASAETSQTTSPGIPKLQASDCQTTISLSNGTHPITRGGAYHVTGQATGQLVVDAKSCDVYLLLDGVTLTSADGPAIYIKAADHVYILTVEGTQSTLTDSPTYSLPEGEDEPDAAIFSMADLSIGGEGQLIVHAQYADGIVSKDSLFIESDLMVTAVDDAVRGKDCLTVTGSKLHLTAGGDGIKATNESGADWGWISLHDSDITIIADADGVQAVTTVTMDSGILNVTSGGGWDEAHRRQLAQPVSKRDRAAQAAQSAAHEADDGESALASGKGIKADSIRLTGGSLCISARDDALHAGDIVDISGGEITLLSHDDGIHSDHALHISGGTVTINDAYEGFEAAHIEVSGGTTAVRAIDDGWNAASKAVTEANGERKTYDCSIVIAGGQHSVIAGADALDSNGSILVSGGVTLASSSNEQKEVPLDYPMNRECRVTGGTVVIAGSYGKQIQTFNAAENQAAILFKWKERQAANTSLSVQDDQGNALLTLNIPTDFQAVIVSSPDIQLEKSYRILTNEALSVTRTVRGPHMLFPVTERRQHTTQAERTLAPLRTPAPNIPPKAASAAPVPGASYGTTQTGSVETENGFRLNYGLYIPQNAKQETLPLIVYLHGGSGKGEDLVKVTNTGFPNMVLNGRLGDVRAYVLYPQCPANERGWSCLTDEVAALMDQIILNYGIDPSRVVLTGHSMGGTGAWSIACEIPQYFSCVIPMSGSVALTEEKLSALSALPIWAFAAANDTVVEAGSTITAMETLQTLLPDNRVTIFSEGGHTDVPELAWLNEEIGLLHWALNQRKQ